MSTTGYPFDNYDGTDESFEELTTPVTCENGCPEGHFGNHKFSCQWSGHLFLDGRRVKVLGEQPAPGAELCIQDADGTNHRHVARGDLTRVQFPTVTVHLSTGQDGNIFSIMGAVTRALKSAGHADAVEDFVKELTSTDSYDAALQVVQRTVSVS